MIYQEAKGKKLIRKTCTCIHGHRWVALFHEAYDHKGNRYDEWAENNGSTCPDCGEQAVN